MNDIIIRRAAEPDAPVILSLLRQLAVYEKLDDIFHLTEPLIHRDLLGANPAAHCDIALLNGVATGLTVWFWLYGSFRARRGLYVEDLYVRPELRGQGVGRALLAHLARQAGEAGAGWMEWKVLDWNKPAIDFYQGIGAMLVQDWYTCRLEGDAMKDLATA